MVYWVTWPHITNIYICNLEFPICGYVDLSKYHKNTQNSFPQYTGLLCCFAPEPKYTQFAVTCEWERQQVTTTVRLCPKYGPLPGKWLPSVHLWKFYLWNQPIYQVFVVILSLHHITGLESKHFCSGLHDLITTKWLILFSLLGLFWKWYFTLFSSCSTIKLTLYFNSEQC